MADHQVSAAWAQQRLDEMVRLLDGERAISEHTQTQLAAARDQVATLKAEAVADRERIKALEEAVALALLFHTGEMWDGAKQSLWEQVTGTNDATTRGLCIYLRGVMGE